MAHTAPAARKKSVTFRDRLSHLTVHQATRLLGEGGAKLLQAGRAVQLWDLEQDVHLCGELLRVNVPDQELTCGHAVVVITPMDARSQQLHVRCDRCAANCWHMGAALHLLLENKLYLGLAAPPDESVPFELLTSEELRERAWEERRERARSERMSLRAHDPERPWTDYSLTSHGSGNTYRVALRGTQPGESYCSCPDFRTNRLGTCKHILHALSKVEKKFKKPALRKPARVAQLALWLDYTGTAPAFRWSIPSTGADRIREILGSEAEGAWTDAGEVMLRLSALQRSGEQVVIYPDAEDCLERELTRRRLREVTDDIRRNPSAHPHRTTLLKVPLLPYQMDGIAFAAGAGRAVLADDMGLGKTIQGIGVAELLSQLADVRRVLVVVPASVKSQWRDEIRRFTDKSVAIVAGNASQRREQYSGVAFFNICNYEQVVRDLDQVERVEWDLIILDEGQRIKNWESKTSRSIRGLRSRFALVLSGTPLENRLDELYTVVKFVDEQRLGPAYEFFNRHRTVDDKGRVLGFRRLDELRNVLRAVLLRRTRSEILDQLPERTTTVLRVRPTEEQARMHSGFMNTVARITRKSYLTEMDLLQLQKALLMCRMSADGTGLVDKEGENYSSKLSQLEELLEGLAEQGDRKIILFSEWRRMLDYIEPLLRRLKMDFVRLDGQVPQQQRPALVQRFQTVPDCRVILMSNAGSTGLNLQAANTVINVDLPWNPAVLEQRVARAHRMGQKNPVHVYLLVTEETLEERLLDTLAAKHELSNAALDVDSDVNEVEMTSGLEELRRRAEKLLGQKPDAVLDDSLRQRTETEIAGLEERRERVAAAGGQLVGAALQLVGELLADRQRMEPDPAAVDLMRTGLTQSLERDSAGRPQLRLTLPDDQALNSLAETFARLLVTK